MCTDYKFASGKSALDLTGSSQRVVLACLNSVNVVLFYNFWKTTWQWSGGIKYQTTDYNCFVYTWFSFIQTLTYMKTFSEPMKWVLCSDFWHSFAFCLYHTLDTITIEHINMHQRGRAINRYLYGACLVENSKSPRTLSFLYAVAKSSKQGRLNIKFSFGQSEWLFGILFHNSNNYNVNVEL